MRSRGIAPALAAALLLAGPIAVLLATRSAATSASAWSTDQMVRTACWGLACACTAWIAITMLSCVVAFLRVDAVAALRVAGSAPPIVRPVLQTLFAGAVAVAPMTSETTPPPIHLHAGADGRLVPGQARVAPKTTSTTARPTPTPRSTSSTTPSTTTPPVSVPPSEPAAPLVPAAHPRRAVAAPGDVRVVRKGDNLWSIARAEVVRASGDACPSNATISAYWRRAIALNRATLRSGDPSLIFPGEIVALPNP